MSKYFNKSYLLVLIILLISLGIKLNTNTLDIVEPHEVDVLVPEFMEMIQTSTDSIDNYRKTGDKTEILKSYKILDESTSFYRNIEDRQGVNYIEEENFYDSIIRAILIEFQDNYSNEDEKYWDELYEELSSFNEYIQGESFKNGTYRKPYFSNFVKSEEFEDFNIIEVEEL